MKSFSIKLEKIKTPNSYKRGLAWQRPTLTGGEPPTTIGAEKLNFRVRYGNGCDLLAIVTKLIKDIYYYTVFLKFFKGFYKKIIPSKLDNAEEELEERRNTHFNLVKSSTD